MQTRCAKEFEADLRRNFPFELTPSQAKALTVLAAFCCDTGTGNAMVLRGFAGTGKTTLIGSLLKSLGKQGQKAILLAPTGRAAKVITQYTRSRASTIHRKIYTARAQKGGGVSFVLDNNPHRKAVFIVDEASMISSFSASDPGLNRSSSLLDDLIEYVEGGSGCRLLFVGDTAQLPPVHSELSPALDSGELSLKIQGEVRQAGLTDVVRQVANSGILQEATALRLHLTEGNYAGFRFRREAYPDVVRLTEGYDIQEALDQAYSHAGIHETVLIVRSNKRANLYNQSIRERILFQENLISAGDRLMVVKNNYFWLDAKSSAGFIANGDTLEILEIRNIQELYGFQFADVKVQLADYPDEPPLDTLLLLDTLHSENPSLTYEQQKELYRSVSEDFEYISSSYRRLLAVRNSPHLNALQVKFSYALTCHKSQGGQWDHVFIEHPYQPDGPDRAYIRWLYTAVTRAKKCLYLIGFPGQLFTED